MPEVKGTAYRSLDSDSSISVSYLYLREGQLAEVIDIATL